MRSTTKILSAIVFSFSTAILGAGCNAVPVADIATEGAAAQESAALREVVVNDDSAIAEDSAALDDEQGSALAEDVDNDIREPLETNQITRPLCQRCQSSCMQRLQTCRLYPGGRYPGQLYVCLRQYRLCRERCRLVCRY